MCQSQWPKKANAQQWQRQGEVENICEDRWVVFWRVCARCGSVSVVCEHPLVVVKQCFWQFFGHLCQDLQRINREIRRLGWQQLRRTKPTAFMMKVALAIYVLSNYIPTVAIQYLAHHRSHLEFASLQTMVEDAFLNTEDVALSKIFQPETQMEHRIKTAALKFMAKHAVTAFTENQNENHGVAPTSRMLADAYVEQCKGLGIPGASSSLEHSLEKHRSRACYKWAARFRKRFGLRLWILKTRDTLPEADVRARVGCLSCHLLWLDETILFCQLFQNASSLGFVSNTENAGSCGFVCNID